MKSRSVFAVLGLVLYAGILLGVRFASASASTGVAAAPLASVEMQELFWKAAKSGDIRSLKSALANGVAIDTQNAEGYTALIYATYYGHEEAVQYLLEAKDVRGRKVDPCLGDKKGNTALFGALFKGFDRLALKLMPLCSIDQTNKQGQTPLMYASLFGRTEMAKALLKAGVDPVKKDYAGYDAIGLAEGQWNQIMVKVLKATRVIR